MPTSLTRLAQLLRRLSHLEKLFLVLGVLVVLSQGIERLTGSRLPLSGLLTFLWVLLCIGLGIKYLMWLVRRTVWSLRNRLILAYLFIGVVPIILVLVMLGIGMYVLMGQVATYLMTAELNRRNETVRDCAYALAWNVADHWESPNGKATATQFLQQLRQRLAKFQAVLRVDEQVFPLPSDGGLTEFPGWSREGFLGLINSGREYAMAAHIRVEQSGHDFEVFAYEPVSPKLLGALLPRMASTSFLELQNTDSEGLEYSATEGRVTGAPGSVAGGQPQPAVRFERQNREEMEVREAVVLPPSRAWWDIEVRWGTPLPVWRWEAGKSTDAPVLVIVVSRPSLIIRQLFSTLGPLAGSVLFAFSVIGALFLLVEIVSLVFGVGLTRSITRSVADLYQATLKVNAGDFSGRIPIRSKDQLSELGASFNQMTASIQKLIAESKEKERLESELEIAREVQSQLFPKEVPQLRGLEVTGLCRPARMVSGDYYDFVQLNSEWTAVAIGDIAGKGVSAALLMASIQSSLRAQLGSCLPLTNGTSSPVFAPSTAELTGALNRQLFESTSSEKFATFFVALYHERTSDLFYTNAGHLPPVLIRSGQPHRLEVNGMVLGAFPDQTYERGYLKLRPGDLLAAFTDGITEPENEYGEEFGEGRLIDLLTQNVNRPLNEIAQQVTDVVQEWGGPFEPPDDMTLLLLRRI